MEKKKSEKLGEKQEDDLLGERSASDRESDDNDSNQPGVREHSEHVPTVHDVPHGMEINQQPDLCMEAPEEAEPSETTRICEASTSKEQPAYSDAIEKVVRWRDDQARDLLPSTSTSTGLEVESARGIFNDRYNKPKTSEALMSMRPLMQPETITTPDTMEIKKYRSSGGEVDQPNQSVAYEIVFTPNVEKPLCQTSESRNSTPKTETYSAPNSPPGHSRLKSKSFSTYEEATTSKGPVVPKYKTYFKYGRKIMRPYTDKRSGTYHSAPNSPAGRSSVKSQSSSMEWEPSTSEGTIRTYEEPTTSLESFVPTYESDFNYGGKSTPPRTDKKTKTYEYIAPNAPIEFFQFKSDLFSTEPQPSTSKGTPQDNFEEDRNQSADGDAGDSFAPKRIRRKLNFAGEGIYDYPSTSTHDPMLEEMAMEGTSQRCNTPEMRDEPSTSKPDRMKIETMKIIKYRSPKHEFVQPKESVAYEIIFNPNNEEPVIDESEASIADQRPETKARKSPTFKRYSKSEPTMSKRATFDEDENESPNRNVLPFTSLLNLQLEEIYVNQHYAESDSDEVGVENESPPAFMEPETFRRYGFDSLDYVAYNAEMENFVLGNRLLPVLEPTSSRTSIVSEQSTRSVKSTKSKPKDDDYDLESETE